MRNFNLGDLWMNKNDKCPCRVTEADDTYFRFSNYIGTFRQDERDALVANGWHPLGGKTIHGVGADAPTVKIADTSKTRLVCPEDYEEPPPNKYVREVHGVGIDVYDVLMAFGVTCPATQHAIKKLLCAGTRGHKTKQQDLTEAREAIGRAIVLAAG